MPIEPASAVARAARSRLEQLRLKGARLAGVREAAVRQEAELVGQVAEAKGRLTLVEEADAALDGLQRRAHQRSVGAFEKMLTAIMKDVLPEKGDVKLELGTERGAPALDVNIDNAGFLESAFKGSGGAVTNVLSSGLRFAALSRTTNRKFVVLDEPDCWLKPERVRAFFGVLAEVAARAGTQTVLISHHEPALFEGLVDIVKLSRSQDGIVRAQVLEPHGDGWPDDQVPGIRSIQLINFGAHTDTLLPLFPKVTAVIGDNDLGKSTLAAEALRAVAYGEVDDTFIHHGAAEAKVIIRLEQGKRIEWVRKAKGSPKVTYALYEAGADEPVHKGSPSTRGQVPQWVTEALGVVPVDDLDIQLGDQKSPVFLLDEGPSTRAKVLSVGREAGRLHALIESYGDLKRKDREKVRTGETEIGRLRQRIEGSVSLAEIRSTIEAAAQGLEELERISMERDRLAKLIEKVSVLEQRRATLTAYATVLEQVPQEVPALEDIGRIASLVDRIASLSTRREGLLRRAAALEGLPQESPVLEDTGLLSSLIERMDRFGRTASLRREFALPAAPVLQDVSKVIELGQRIGILVRKVLPRGQIPMLPEVPQVKDLGTMARAIELISIRTREHSRNEEGLKAAAAAAHSADTELKAFIESLGSVCPTCGGGLDAQGRGALHAHQEVA